MSSGAVFTSFSPNKTPAKKPTRPKPNICHGVHGPWPKNIFDISPAAAPVINPASALNATAVSMTMAHTGLNCGAQ